MRYPQRKTPASGPGSEGAHSESIHVRGKCSIPPQWKREIFNLAIDLKCVYEYPTPDCDDSIAAILDFARAKGVEEDDAINGVALVWPKISEDTRIRVILEGWENDPVPQVGSAVMRKHSPTWCDLLRIFSRLALHANGEPFGISPKLLSDEYVAKSEGRTRALVSGMERQGILVLAEAHIPKRRARRWLAPELLRAARDAAGALDTLGAVDTSDALDAVDPLRAGDTQDPRDTEDPRDTGDGEDALDTVDTTGAGDTQDPADSRDSEDTEDTPDMRMSVSLVNQHVTPQVRQDTKPRQADTARLGTDLPDDGEDDPLVADLADYRARRGVDPDAERLVECPSCHDDPKLREHCETCGRVGWLRSGDPRLRATKAKETPDKAKDDVCPACDGEGCGWCSDAGKRNRPAPLTAAVSTPHQ